MKVYELMAMLGQFPADAPVSIWTFLAPSDMTYDEDNDMYEVNMFTFDCDIDTNGVVSIG